MEKYDNVLPVLAMTWTVDLEIVIIYVGAAPAGVTFVTHIHVGLVQTSRGPAVGAGIGSRLPLLMFPESSIAATL